MPPSILIVEDEVLIGTSLTNALKRHGYSCVLAGSVPAAIKLIRHQPFDAAILDVNLRGVLVYPVAELLNSIGIPFIFTTGYPVVSFFNERPIVRKPYEAEQVLRRLSDVLGKSAGSAVVH
jgi:DNA-binding response OmpR family regulator